MSCTAYNSGTSAQVTIGGTLASDFCHTDWPTTFLAFIAAMQASLPSGVSTFTIGSDTPGAGDQDKLWFKVDASCVPVGWFIYYGGAWVRAIPHPLLPGFIIDYFLSSYAALTEAQVADAVKLLDGGTALNPFWRISDGTNGTPDLRGRVRVGAGQGGAPLTNRVSGASGGAETHTLQVTEIPAHTHGVPTGTSGGSTAAAQALAGAPSFTSDANTGGNGAHNNMPPFFVVWPIIRTSRML